MAASFMTGSHRSVVFERERSGPINFGPIGFGPIGFGPISFL